MKKCIDYYPLTEHPQLKAMALVLALFSLLLVLTLFNHVVRYGGVLPIEFWLAPCLFGLIACLSAGVCRDDSGFVVIWKLMGFVVRQQRFEALEVLQVGSNLELVGLAGNVRRSLFLVFSDLNLLDKFKALGIRASI